MTCCHGSARCVLVRAVIVAVFLMLLSQTLAAAEVYDQVVGLAPMASSSPGKGLAVFFADCHCGRVWRAVSHFQTRSAADAQRDSVAQVGLIGGVVQTLVSFGWIALFVVAIVFPVDFSIGAVVFVAFVLAARRWLRRPVFGRAQCKRTVILGEGDFYSVLIRHANLDKVISLVKEGARCSSGLLLCVRLARRQSVAARSGSYASVARSAK
jgi:hypothetical protein